MPNPTPTALRRTPPLLRQLTGFSALLVVLVLLAWPASAQDAGEVGVDAAVEAPEVGATPDAAAPLGPDLPPTPVDPLEGLGEPWRGQLQALRSDDPATVAALLGVPVETYATREGLDARRSTLRARDQERADAQEAADRRAAALERLAEELRADLDAEGTTWGGALMARARLAGVARQGEVARGESDELSAEGVILGEEEAFLDRRAAQLAQPAEARANDEADRARRNREAAEREKLSAAQARQDTERRLLQAEAERVDAQRFEQEYQELAQREPRILEEKLYIEARRQYELSAALEGQGTRAAEFNAYKDKVTQAIKGIYERLDRREKPEEAQADAEILFTELGVLRQRSAEDIRDFDLPLQLVRASLEGVGDDVAAARQRVNELNAVHQNDTANRLNRKRLTVAQAEHQRLVAYEQMLELKEQIQLEGQELAYQRLIFARNAQAELLDALPDASHDALYTLDAANFSKLPGELGDFYLVFRHYLKERRAQVRQLGAQALTLQGALWVVKLGVLSGVLGFVIQFIRGRRDGWLKRLSEAMLRQRMLRRRRPFVLKLLEILHAILLPTTALLLVQLLLDLFPADAPLVVIASVLINSALIYAIVINVIKTLVLPRSYREGHAALDADPAPGAVLIDVDVQVGRFIVATLRWMLLYTLACQYSLYLVRAALDDFFIAHWVTILGYLGYLVVVYVLLSRWRDAIAGRFARLIGARSPQAAEFVNTRKTAFYGVGLIFVALLYVLGREGYTRVRRWMTGLEITQQIRNFFFRKQIEMSTDEEHAAPDEASLPVAYRQAFSAQALPDAAWLVERPAAESLQAARRAWRDEGRCGSIALLGEQGMGKTTLLRVLREGWIAAGEPVTSTALPARLLSAQGALRFIARLFNQPVGEDATLHPVDLAEQIVALPPRTVIIDDCHHLYLRTVGGFEALEAFREVVRLSDRRHCWIMAFNPWAWRYLERISELSRRFGTIVAMEPMGAAAIQALIEARSHQTGFTLDFSRLVLDDLGEEDTWAEVSRSAHGYFRLLAEAARGNPTIAMHLWLRSLRYDAEGQRLRVALFHPRPTREVVELSDELKFMLAAIIQHDALNVAEFAEILQTPATESLLALNFLRERGFVEVEPRFGRARVAVPLYRPILSHLSANNFLQE